MWTYITISITRDSNSTNSTTNECSRLPLPLPLPPPPCRGVTGVDDGGSRKGQGEGELGGRRGGQGEGDGGREGRGGLRKGGEWMEVGARGGGGGSRGGGGGLCEEASLAGAGNMLAATLFLPEPPSPTAPLYQYPEPMAVPTHGVIFARTSSLRHGAVGFEVPPNLAVEKL